MTQPIQTLKSGLLCALVLWAGLLTQSAQAQPLPNHSAYIDALQTAPDRPPSADLQRLLDAGAPISIERALGVPTFLWAGQGWGAPLPTTAKSPLDAARHHLKALRSLYSLSEAAIDGFDATLSHDTGVGGIIVTFRQSVGGVQVHRHRLSVLMDRNLTPVAVSGYLFPHHDPHARKHARSFTLPPQAAISVAFDDRHGAALDPAAWKATHSARAPYDTFNLDPSHPAWGLHIEHFEDVRIKPVLFGMPDRLEPAYYLELISSDLGQRSPETWSYVISAYDGRLLERESLDFAFEYNVWADPVDGWPLDSPNGSALSPVPRNNPEAVLETFVDPALIDIPTGLNRFEDPWLADDATETRGNNVDAYADISAGNGFTDGDLRATVSEPGIFGWTYDPLASHNDDEEQIMASVTHLFYVINYLHDVFYEHGFDEAAGNGQEDNFDRGGIGGDSLRAEAQDFSGTNNANMATPADGGNPRMQIFVHTQGEAEAFVSSGDDEFRQLGLPLFGTRQGDVTANLALVNDGTDNPTLGCEAPTNDLTDRIAIIDRGECSFEEKVRNAQGGGAVGALIVNNQNGVINMSPQEGGQGILIPFVMITTGAGQILKDSLQEAPTEARLFLGVPPSTRSGSVDVQLVAHEWGHYLFQRLTGGAGNPQGGGLNEGTADFVALLMAVRAEDTEIEGNDDFQGPYTVAAYARHNARFGLRRAAYSTDPAVNALTFAHIENGAQIPDTFPFRNFNNNSEVHNSGEIWAQVMWDVLVYLLNNHPFEEARSRMMGYLVAGLKLTPANMTFTEIRDGILAAALAGDPNDFQGIWGAFAGRGMGPGAQSPARGSGANAGVIEDFELSPDLTITRIVVEDSVDTCDDDGILDRGELGQVRVEIFNTGPFIIDDAQLSLTSEHPNAAFPEGQDFNVPSMEVGERISVEIPMFLNDIPEVRQLQIDVSVTAQGLVRSDTRLASATVQIHTDETPQSSTSDDVEASATVWTVEFDPELSEPPPFERIESPPSNHLWHAVDSANGVSDLYLISPPLDVTETGDFTFSFSHRYQFESTDGTHYDAGVMELSTDGEAWTDIGDFASPGYNGQVTELGNNQSNPLANRQAWVDRNPSHPDLDRVSVNLGTQYQGQTVQIRFRLGTDPASGGDGWDLDDFSFENIDNLPFPEQGPDTGLCLDTPPVADAGEDQAADEGDLVTLDGTASYDPLGSELRFGWRQLEGPEVIFEDQLTANPTFITPEIGVDTDLVFALQVLSEDNRSSEEEDTVTVSVRAINDAPIANAGENGTVLEGEVYNLDGTASSDPDGNPLAYIWVQSQGPAVAIEGATSAQPSFEAPQVLEDTDLRFQLIVSDGQLTSALSSVIVTVTHLNLPPIANAGPDQLKAPDEAITLDGTLSEDEDGATLTFKWRQVEGEPEVELKDAQSPTPSFEVSEVKTGSVLVFELIVNDGELDSAPALTKVAFIGEAEIVVRTIPDSGCTTAPVGTPSGPLPLILMLIGAMAIRRRT